MKRRVRLPASSEVGFGLNPITGEHEGVVTPFDR